MTLKQRLPPNKYGRERKKKSIGRKANWASQGAPRSRRRPASLEEGEVGKKVFKLRNRKANVEHPKGREFGKSAILVGESQLKPRFWENRDHSSQIPVRPAETTKSTNNRILRIKRMKTRKMFLSKDQSIPLITSLAPVLGK